MSRWDGIAVGLTVMIVCLNNSIAKIRYPDDSGFDCEGEVGKGTLPHKVVFSNRSDALFCCYPVTCLGGTIDFCTKDMERDTCIPCKKDCNYQWINSYNLFQMEIFCRVPCRYAIPIVMFNLTQYTKHREGSVTLQPIIHSDHELQGFCWEFYNSSGSHNLAGCNSSDFDSRKYKVGNFKEPFLTINDVNLSDQGIYRLIVWNMNGVSNIANVTLNVTARPVVIMQRNVDVDEGSEYNVRCLVKGNPEPNIVNMTFRGKEKHAPEQLKIYIQPGGEVTHIIQNVSTIDSGNYTCSAENTEGTGGSTLHLIVNTKPIIYSPETGKTLEYDTGENMSMSVSVTFNPKLTEVFCHQSDDQSKKMSFNIPHINDRWMIYNASIPNITPSYTGMYVCSATNRLGKSRIFVNISVKSGGRTENAEGTESKDMTLILVVIVISVAVIFLVIVPVTFHHRRNRQRDNTNTNEPDEERVTERLVSDGGSQQPTDPDETADNTNPSESTTETDSLVSHSGSQQPTGIGHDDSQPSNENEIEMKPLMP